MIGFRLGDPGPTPSPTQGEACRRAGVSLKARLLFVSWIQVEGKLVQSRAQADRDRRAHSEVPVTTDVPTAQQAPAPSKSAEDAADDDSADASALAAAESVLIHKASLPGPCLLIVSRRPSGDHHPWPTGHRTIHGRNGDFNVGRLRPPSASSSEERRTRPNTRRQVRGCFLVIAEIRLYVQRQRPHGHRGSAPSWAG